MFLTQWFFLLIMDIKINPIIYVTKINETNAKKKIISEDKKLGILEPYLVQNVA